MPSGLTLFELLGYMALSLLLITLMGSLGVALYSSSLRGTRTIDRALEMSVALHSIARDIKGAKEIEIKRQTGQSFIISRDGKDIGWLYEKGTLVRYVGYYEKACNEWKLSARSQLATGLNNVRFSCRSSANKKVSITCYLESGSIALELSIGVP